MASICRYLFQFLCFTLLGLAHLYCEFDEKWSTGVPFSTHALAFQNRNSDPVYHSDHVYLDGNNCVAKLSEDYIVWKIQRYSALGRAVISYKNGQVELNDGDWMVFGPRRLKKLPKEIILDTFDSLKLGTKKTSIPLVFMHVKFT